MSASASSKRSSGLEHFQKDRLASRLFKNDRLPQSLLVPSFFPTLPRGGKISVPSESRDLVFFHEIFQRCYICLYTSIQVLGSGFCGISCTLPGPLQLLIAILQLCQILGNFFPRLSFFSRIFFKQSFSLEVAQQYFSFLVKSNIGGKLPAYHFLYFQKFFFGNLQDCIFSQDSIFSTNFSLNFQQVFH